MNMADRCNEEMNAERKRKIKRTDEYRKEKFSDIFPELNNFLRVYE
jgi:hypothetical protein